jgi:hypothetical protein
MKGNELKETMETKEVKEDELVGQSGLGLTNTDEDSTP